jgi:hypothetical protein
MLVCPPHKFLVILPARCGSTSAKAALNQRFPRLREQGANHGVRILLRQRGYFKVCLKRNPYRRVLSIWQHWLTRPVSAVFKHSRDNKVRNVVTAPQLSFCDFLHSGEARSLLLTICPPITRLVQRLQINLWVEQETLEADLNKIPAIGDTRLVLPHRNRSNYANNWQSYYTPQLVSLVYGLYRDDFVRFGYPKELP